MNATPPTPRFGRLIGVSLGPGDPELITRRGWAALQSGARWAYPVKKAAERSYASTSRAAADSTSRRMRSSSCSR